MSSKKLMSRTEEMLHKPHHKLTIRIVTTWQEDTGMPYDRIEATIYGPTGRELASGVVSFGQKWQLSLERALNELERQLKLLEEMKVNQ